MTWGDAPLGDRLRAAGAPGLTERLERWVADARIDDSALRRGRERWLRQAADEEATLAGALLDLAERRSVVTIRATTGRTHQGVVEVLGADFAGLRVATGAPVLLATSTITTVRSAPGEDPAGGDRAVQADLRLVEVLRELAADRERALLVVAGGEELVRGEVRSVGQDVVVVRADGDPPVTVYVPVTAVAEVGLG